MSKYPYNDIGESDIAIKYVGINYLGDVVSIDALPTGSTIGDAYYITSGTHARDMAIWNGKSWDFSPWAGKDGTDGIGFNIIGTVPIPQNLPINPNLKDAYYCEIDGRLYICNNIEPVEWLALPFRGERGISGQNGQDGNTPWIGVNGNWWIGETDTGVKAAGTDGANGVNGQDGAAGIAPTIGSNGYWYIGNVNTGVKASGTDGINGTDGQDGQDGQDGATPTIGDNGNWWINNIDTGITATGKDGRDGQDGQDGRDGQDGATPTIGENGDWWINGLDTGKPSRGEQGNGVALGGTTGQSLKKASDNDNDTYWANDNKYFGGVARSQPQSTISINPTGATNATANDFVWCPSDINVDWTDFDIVLGVICIDNNGHFGVCVYHNIPASGIFEDMNIIIQGIA